MRAADTRVDPIGPSQHAGPSPAPRVGLIFTGLMLAMVLASLDQTIVSTALPTSSASWAV